MKILIPEGFREKAYSNKVSVGLSAYNYADVSPDGVETSAIDNFFDFDGMAPKVISLTRPDGQC